MRVAFVTAAVTLAACSGAARRATPPPVASFALAFPPAPAELARVDAAADAGDARAAWEHLHVLLDLFDAARFGRDEGARRALLGALKVVEGDRARAAITDEALDRMLVSADRLLRIERLSADGQAARTLLEQDRHPAGERDKLYARAGTLKSIARGGGPLAPNAALRLAGVCLQAFRDAAAAPLHRRAARLAFCLYPLWDSDPEPYLDPDPRRRPPPPVWTDLDARLQKLAGEVAAGQSRVAAAARRALDDHRALVRKAEADRLFVPRLDPSELGVPKVADAPLLYDGEPLVLGAGEVSAGALEPLVRADDRARVALVLPADAPASALASAAAAARQAGARTVGVGVGVEQAVKAPAGDYWAGRDRIGRLGLIPIAVAAGEEARAALSLHLVLTPSKWSIVAPGGALPAIAADPAKLGETLATVRRAFPDEDGLYVVPSVPVETLVAALASARQAGFHWLALAAAPPSPKGDLADRIARRAAADVRVVPDALADRAGAARGCYLAALDRSPRLAGTVRLEITKGQAKVTGAGDAALQKCLEDRVLPRMRDTGIPSAQVELLYSK